MTNTRLEQRAIVRLAARDDSEDIAAFLQGLVTNDVSGDLPAYAALLSSQGKCMFDFLVWQEGNDVLLDCEREKADELVKRLSLYRLRRQIDIVRDDDLATYWSPIERPEAAPDPRLPALGWRWIGPNDGSEPADAEWLAHRLALGVPEGAAELGDILWLETNAAELNGVSFTKGCYVGQENTARMNWRQKINRRLLVVPIDISDEKRRRIAYPELGLAVDHARTENIDPDTAPDWMKPGLSPAE